MDLGEFADLNYYPTLCEFAGNITAFMEKSDPLGVLLMGCSDNVRQVAKFTEQCLKHVKNVNKDWFASKSKRFQKDRTQENVSAVLAEIRAYGILLRDWNISKIGAPPKSGCDFMIQLGTQTLRIEVNAPQWAGGGKTTSQVIERTAQGPIFSELAEVIPFGTPMNPDEENFATMAISKICSIKQKEHQFNTDDLSILWLDYWDPVRWPFSMAHHGSPYTAQNTKLELGWFWHAFYARKGDPIFDSAMITGAQIKAIPLLHDGRFYQEDCKIDLVIVSDPRNLFAFQNPNRPNKFSDFFFALLIDSPFYRTQESWLDWPIRGALSSKIDQTRHEIDAMLRALKSLGPSGS